MFQALVLAFWRFQGLAATTLCRTVLEALQRRAAEGLTREFPGRFRHKGTRPRTWELPFGRVTVPLLRLRDQETGRVVEPLREAVGLPARVRWTEETLLPGFRLAVLQSFRESTRAVAKSSPRGTGPHASTLHRRFQGFSERLEPVPEASADGTSDPTRYQQADGTKVKLQAHGRGLGDTDLRLVLGSRTPHGKVEVLDFSVGDGWEDVAARIRTRFRRPEPDVLVSDGEEEIPQALAGPQTRHQRCLVHARRGLPFALYRDGIKKPDQETWTEPFQAIPALQVCQAEVDQLGQADRGALQHLLETSEQAFAALLAKLPRAACPHTHQYVLGLIQDGLTYLRLLLEGGPETLVSTNRAENLMGRLALRLKRIGKRWSIPGALNMLAAVLTTALHPEDYERVEGLVRGEDKPTVAILITSLQSAWVT